MSRLNSMQDSHQQSVEDCAADLGTSLALLDHDMLRVKQAIRRTGLNDLLGPVVEDYQRIRRQIVRAQGRLRVEWDRGQEEEWKEKKV
jgi:hypothetical protein